MVLRSQLLEKENLIMDYDNEKRQYPRTANEIMMNLYRMDLQDELFYAQMQDYSQGGLSMKTREKLVIGQLVCLESADTSPLAGVSMQNKNHCGSVRWERPESFPDGTRCYRYGVEYLEPVPAH
jgi:hypothetical protein